jgi:hypothetical protein
MTLSLPPGLVLGFYTHFQTTIRLLSHRGSALRAPWRGNLPRLSPTHLKYELYPRNPHSNSQPTTSLMLTGVEVSFNFLSVHDANLNPCQYFFSVNSLLYQRVLLFESASSGLEKLTTWVATTIG